MTIDINLQDPVAVLNYYFYDQGGLKDLATDATLSAYLAMPWTISGNYNPDAKTNTLVYTSGTSNFTVKYTQESNQKYDDLGMIDKGIKIQSFKFNGSGGQVLFDYASNSNWDGKGSWSQSDNGGYSGMSSSKHSDSVKMSYKEKGAGINIITNSKGQGGYSSKWVMENLSSKASGGGSGTVNYSDAAGFKLNMAVTHTYTENGSSSYSAQNDSIAFQNNQLNVDNLKISYSDASKNIFNLTAKVTETKKEVDWNTVENISKVNVQSMVFSTADYSIATKPFSTSLLKDALFAGVDITDIKTLFSKASPVMTSLISLGDNTIVVKNATTGQSVNGGAGKDTITGNAAADRLNGGDSSDVLTGGKGADIFVFNTALGQNNVDTIKDFKLAEGDKIELSSSIFAATEFGINLVYQSSSGKLFYDADGAGSGAPIHFATLVGKPALTAENFGDVFTIV